MTVTLSSSSPAQEHVIPAQSHIDEAMETQVNELVREHLITPAHIEAVARFVQSFDLPEIRELDPEEIKERIENDPLMENTTSDITDQCVQTLDHHEFSPKEIKDVIDFCSTPVGKKWVDASFQISQLVQGNLFRLGIEVGKGMIQSREQDEQVQEK